MGEAIQLIADPLDHLRRPGADTRHRDATREVDEMVAVDIDEDTAVGPLDEHRQGAAEPRWEMLLAVRLQRP
ncbi:hypothetical protein GCM10010530_25150 [Kribbella aluminosa]